MLRAGDGYFYGFAAGLGHNALFRIDGGNESGVDGTAEWAGGVFAVGAYMDLISFVPSVGLVTAPGVPFVQASDGLLYGTLLPSSASSGGSTFVYDLGLPAPAAQPEEFAPAAAAAGAVVLVQGRQLLQATSVEFNGVPARFTVH